MLPRREDGQWGIRLGRRDLLSTNFNVTLGVSGSGSLLADGVGDDDPDSLAFFSRTACAAAWNRNTETGTKASNSETQSIKFNMQSNLSEKTIMWQ